MTYSNGNEPRQAAMPDQVHVTTVELRPDPFAGLVGHAYIHARGLNKPIRKVQTSAQVLAACQVERK